MQLKEYLISTSEEFFFSVLSLKLSLESRSPIPTSYGAMSSPGGVCQELQQKRAQQAAEAQQTVDRELDDFRRSGRVGRKKPPAKTLLVNNSPSSPRKNGPASPTDVKARNTGLSDPSGAVGF